MFLFLLLLQLLVISCFGATEEGGQQPRQKRGRIQHLFYLDKTLLEREVPRELLREDPTDSEGIRAGPSLYVAALEHAAENKKPGEKKLSRFTLPFIELQTTQSSPAQKEALLSDSLRNFSPPHSSREREAESSYRKDAKKFWDHFTLQKNSASEEVVLPIKTDEMHQETCWTLPFSQGIVHENCEKVVVQNNLCFGKCNSFHVPGPEDRLYTFCSHCLPAKFNLKRLELNCTKSIPIVKVVVIVEECKCKIQKTNGPEIGPLHSDLHANVYGHN
ncbi:PREDICTED: cerberus [Crocodylus porosus]|uniref:Cerberus 1, DAN family BMP antagonist n=1 Tax=Crocodylus porosus TaxID=8502 RepID=A0A7M4DYQ9_CROPO|nr:PREDICTED: cerberus [Crocodylus porosus]